MTEIVLTEEQARLVSQARGRVTVRTPTGEDLGQFDPTEAAVVREWKGKKRSNGVPCFTDDQIGGHIDTLRNEWDRTGGFDRNRLLQLLDQLAADDPPKYQPNERP